jgi:hypothetical protein
MPTHLSWDEDQLDETDTQIIRKSLPPQIPPIDLSLLSVVKSGHPSKQPVDNHELLSVKRLIVVVPHEDVDEAQFSRQIWNLASNYRLDIVLISMVSNTNDSMTASRRLTTIAAMTRDSHFKVEKQIVFASSWDKVLHKYWQQMDMILCPAEITISNLLGRTILLSQVLSDRLKAPVYTFSGLYKPVQRRQMPLWMGKLPFWIGFFLIVSICFYFEADVDQLTRGWVGQVLLIMVVIIEIGLIYFWNLIAG